MRMCHYLAAGLVLAGISGFSALGAAAEAPTTAPSAAPSAAPSTQPVKAKPINQYCAVKQDNPVDDRVPTYTYKGQVIGFCCPDCVDEFKADPEKYMATIK